MLHPLPAVLNDSWAVASQTTATNSNSDGQPKLRTDRLWPRSYNGMKMTKAPDFSQDSLWMDGWYRPGLVKEMLQTKDRINGGKTASEHAEREGGCSYSEELGQFGPVGKSSFRPPVLMDASQMQQSSECCWETLSLEDSVSILERMADLPSIDKLICMLQKCRKKKNLMYAKRVYAYIHKNGLESHRAVGNYIVPMFVECASIYDAQQIFNSLVHRNVHSWTSLIIGYIECGKLQHALNLYQKMQEDSVYPSSYTLVVLLKACARLKDVERGREIHRDITQKGYESDIFVGNTLIDMYAKCGSLAEALEVFSNMPVRDVVSWTALISGYAEHSPHMEALERFQHMQLEGFSPNAVTFVCVLKACGNTGAIDKGRELHADIAQRGFDRNVFIGSTLVDMYAKCGALAEAQETFAKLLVRNVVSWNALLAGYAEHGHDQEALKCFEQMQLEGIFPDAVTFVCILKACGSTGAIDKGREIHVDLAQKGLERVVCVGNTLVDMYAKCGSLSEAHDAFDKLPVRDVISWTALIAGYAEHGPSKEALKCFEHMQSEGISPDVATFVCALKACGNIKSIGKGQEIHANIVQRGFDRNAFVGNTLVGMYAKCGSLADAQEVFDKLAVRDVVSWNALIAGYTEQGLCQEGLACFEHMQVEGFFPNVVTFVCVLKACGVVKAIDKLQKTHANIAQNGFERELVVGNTLVDTYAKCGSVAKAREVFDKLPTQDVVSWTALIAGYAEHGPGQEALICFEHMQMKGISPNSVTFVFVLKACGNLGAIEKGREIHADIAGKGFERDVPIGNTLVDMYAKCGSLLEAQEVFDKLPVQDVVSWSSMIKGYGINHEGNMAVQCFKDMQEQGVKPTVVTFTCLLTACSRAGLVLEGQEFFKAMQEEYGMAPTIDHYTCMVDILAQSGHLPEAEDFLESMPCPPSEVTWTALLSGCKTYGEAYLGLRCFQQLVLMNPECASHYLLMAKIYASAGRWDDVYRTEQLRKHAGAKKKPAIALIEVNKKVHEFVVGHERSKEISEKLRTLASRMKEEGHVPKVNLILRPIFDEEKEAALCEHAEKLAIAFGLLNTPQGQTLRVTKNLRMCDDCHDASKIISRIEKREIIIRDIYHVHHFRDGLCSCNNV